MFTRHDDVMLLFWCNLCHDLLMIDLFVMQSKIIDETSGRKLAEDLR